MHVSWCLVALYSVAVYLAQGANILIYPLAHGFNTRMEDMSTIANILNENGHTVQAIVNMEEARIFEKRAPDAVLHEFPAPGDVPRYMDSEYREIMFSQSEYSWSNLLKQIELSSKQQESYCEKLLLMKPMLKQLKEQKFDLFIVDFLEVCGRIIKYYLNVPTIAYSSHGYSVDPVMFPMLPSFIPAPLRGKPQRTGFWERLWNSVAMWNSPFLNGNMYSSFEKLAKKHGFAVKGRDLEFAYVDALVILMCHPALDYMRPTFSNVKCFAGMNDWPHQELDNETKAFMQSAGDAGVIVVSFGSILNTIEAKKASMIANALSRLPQKVIWRHKGPKKDLERKNIKIVDWFPQTSLLQHEKTRLFITHCGDHSTLETAIHAVPVIAMPVYLDQFENAIRLTDKAGMGKVVEYGSATEEKLFQSIKEVLRNKTYYENAKLTSSLILDRPIDIHKEFMYQVNYVIRYKGIPQQIADPVRSLSTLEIYNVDVFVFMFFACIVAGIFALIGAFLLWKVAVQIRKMHLQKKAL